MSEFTTGAEEPEVLHDQMHKNVSSRALETGIDVRSAQNADVVDALWQDEYNRLNDMHANGEIDELTMKLVLRQLEQSNSQLDSQCPHE